MILTSLKYTLRNGPLNQLRDRCRAGHLLPVMGWERLGRRIGRPLIELLVILRRERWP